MFFLETKKHTGGESRVQDLASGCGSLCAVIQNHGQMKSVGVREAKTFDIL